MNYIQNPYTNTPTSLNSACGQAIEQINDTDSLSQQPQEMIFRVFGYLSAIELAKCSEVSRKWKRLASDPTLWNALDLRKISPLLKVLDESDWEKHVDMSAYGLTTAGIPPLDKRAAIPFLKGILSSPTMSEIEENAGITLLTIPEGLTVNKLVELGLSPKMGKTTMFSAFSDLISSGLGDIRVEKSYRILITNYIFKNSLSLTVSEQKALVNKIGCEMSEVLEATALLALTHMVSGKQLYEHDCSYSWSSNPEENIPPRPYTFTRCSHQVAGDRFIVGGFDSNGIYVCDELSDSSQTGVGGVLLKF